MLDYLVYNDVSSVDFKAYLSGAGAFELPERDYEKIEIPGRNGDLIIDNEKYKNVEIRYPMIIMEDFEINKRAMMRKFEYPFGYKRLEDTFNPDYYRIGFLKGIEDSKTNWHYDAGSFVLVFDCKPQMYLKSGENSIFVSGTETVLNATNEIALPIIKITGTGQFSINNDTFALLNNTSVTIVDSEAREVYEGTINRNDDFERYNYDLPKLYVGDNVIMCDSGISLEIIPRWWTV